MKTGITELLGIRHPIIQGAMSWVSFPPLVAAVSNAGGLGILGAAFMNPGELRGNIREIRRLTDKPFGVNFMPDNPQLDELLDVIIDEKVPIASYGRGDPNRIIERTKPVGIINMPTMGAVNHAVKAEQNGADAIIVQGTEAGGHASHVSTMVLVPLVVDRVSIPVVAAGGFGDARGLVAALSLGAEGISMGSRFIVTKECPAHPNVKNMIIEASEEKTVVTGNITGVRCRVLRNKLVEGFLEMEQRKASVEEMMKFGQGKIRLAFAEGDMEMGSIAVGQICGMIDDEPTCQEIIDRIVGGAEKVLGRVGEKLTL